MDQLRAAYGEDAGAMKSGRRGRWNLEKTGILVAIVVGIASTIASALAAFYAGEQARLSREALSANERNAAFVGHIEKVGAYCDALDLSGGRSELTWSFVREPPRISVLAAYKQIGTRFPEEARITAVHSSFREMEESVVPLRIWLDVEAVDFIERAVFGLRQELMAKIPRNAGVAIADRIYVEAAAKCIGTREVLMAWYRDAGVWRLGSAADGVTVKLSQRPPF
ncbi:hypothetical protein [Sinorhizobium sp. BJ1]|jgi:hypothetical protein|uniref:hypothetical protein n=1 Tax=Sinorhizobium sp. BJ1 TaxID=2035455 RepID=UPI000BEA8F66|nr:hypothetical protein [Sinorhizobium sp. BJ1]PDT82142.1 hypothetical protein CO676_17900 [Sinorhizobium sp. BJ1]